MSANAEYDYAAVTDIATGDEFYIRFEKDKSKADKLSSVLHEVGNATGATATDDVLRTKKRYVFRKMGVQEFNETMENKRMLYALSENHRTGEKWFTESLHHTREFHNRGSSGPDKVVEFAVDKKGYKGLSDSAIPQEGSKANQPRTGTMKNIYNKEHLNKFPNKKNIGLKGRANVDAFNKTIISVTEINPNSVANKSSILKWLRRNKLQSAGIALSVVLDAAFVTITAFEEGGFGNETKIAIGETIGGSAGASLGILAGAQIGAALGTAVPVLGNIILGFIGAMIGGLIGGKLAAYLFCVDPVAPGLGQPILDTDPRGTARGIPDDGLNTYVQGVPPLGVDTGAFGVPSSGLETGAFGTPYADYETEYQ